MQNTTKLNIWILNIWIMCGFLLVTSCSQSSDTPLYRGDQNLLTFEDLSLMSAENTHKILLNHKFHTNKKGEINMAIGQALVRFSHQTGLSDNDLRTMIEDKLLDSNKVELYSSRSNRWRYRIDATLEDSIKITSDNNKKVYQYELLYQIFDTNKKLLGRFSTYRDFIKDKNWQEKPAISDK